jgi:hypothetical protein
MTERLFRFFLGAWLLIALYFNLAAAVYALIALLLVEGVTNRRVPGIVTHLRGVEVANDGCVSDALASRIPFEAERALRFVLAAMLIVSCVMFRDSLWFFPWFIGFALVGAGLSGVCPMVLALRAVGLR